MRDSNIDRLNTNQCDTLIAMEPNSVNTPDLSDVLELENSKALLLGNLGEIECGECGEKEIFQWVGGPVQVVKCDNCDTKHEV